MKRTSVDSENPSLRVRRQIYDLTPLDLETFPVWEFNLDRTSGNGQDELTIRPCVAAVPLNPADCMFVVRAVFTLADGSMKRGYLTPPGRDDAGIGVLQPIIVADQGQVRFWCGTSVPSPKRLARNYQILGKEAKEVFPLLFESEVELVGGPIRGSIPGFLVMEDFQTRETRTVI